MKLRKQPFKSQQPVRNEYNGYTNGISSESKLPPSLRWALEGDQNEFDNDTLSYQRNSKANVHLAPLGSNLTNNSKGKLYSNPKHGSIITNSNTIYGSPDTSAINKIPSVKKLSSQKTRRLQPLRR